MPSVQPITVQVTPSADVSKGLATIAGYTGGAATVVAPLIAWVAEHQMPTGVMIALFVIGGALTGITTAGRQAQAVANTKAAAAAVSSAVSIPVATTPPSAEAIDLSKVEDTGSLDEAQGDAAAAMPAPAAVEPPVDPPAEPGEDPS